MSETSGPPQDPENWTLVADPSTRDCVKKMCHLYAQQLKRVGELSANQRDWAKPIMEKRAMVAESLLQQIERAEQQTGTVLEIWSPVQLTTKRMLEVDQELKTACKERGLIGLSWPPIELIPGGKGGVKRKDGRPLDTAF